MGGRGWEPIETTARLARVFSNLFPLQIEGRQRLLPPQFLIVNKITSSLHTRIFSDPCPSKNLRNTVHSSLCGFFDAHSQRKTYEVPTRYRADTGKDSVKSAQIFLIFNNCSGWTHPVSSSIEHSSYRYCDDFAKDLPAISRPQGGFFHNSDFETVLPLSKTIAGRNLPVLLRFVLCPTRYSVFCSGKTLIQSRSILSC